MPKRFINKTVFDAAIDRMTEIYRDGHRVIVAFSGGKDSGICVEICIIAATLSGRLPVEVLMRDEEIMIPGTFEYAMRVANRPEIQFNWVYANQPIINLYNREMPYFWVFDPLLLPEQWVREPPDFAYHIDNQNIEMMTIPSRFPPGDDKDLFAVIGLRTQESINRLRGLMVSKSHITKKNVHGTYNVRPIYDWKSGDVWRAIKENGWDYNRAYDTLARLGLERELLRIAPPTINYHGVKQLQLASRAWPGWWEKVCERLPGIELAAKFGLISVTPTRRVNETWEQCFKRVCLRDAPQWIIDRSEFVMEKKLRLHNKHSSEPYPEIVRCSLCRGKVKSWKQLAFSMYSGDPFSLHNDELPYIEPEFFREGAGTWNGTPAFA